MIKMKVIMKKIRYRGAGVALFRKVDDGYEILVERRKYKPGKGKYSIPGGGYEEWDKSLKATAERECREETGIIVKDVCAGKTPVVKRFPFFFYDWATYMYEVDAHWQIPSEKVHELKNFGFVNIKDIKPEEMAFGLKSEIRKFVRVSERRTRKQQTLEFQK